MRKLIPQWIGRRRLPPIVVPVPAAADAADAGGESAAMPPPLLSRDAAGESRRALVKNRPIALEQRYALLDHPALADEVFLRLKRQIFAAIDQLPPSVPTIFREAGKLAPARPYFFLKPQNQKGWLFERSGAGWLVTPAEKIVVQSLFLREDEPIDQIMLFMSKDRVSMPRVKARLTGDELMAFAVYQQRLMQQLGLAP